MTKEVFNDLIKHGFDVEFNYKDVFYSITIGEIKGVSYYFLANENKWHVKFNTIEELDNYLLIDKKIVEILSELSEEEIFY